MIFGRSYLEWCVIMRQTPNERDETIFRAGESFAIIDSLEHKGHDKITEIKTVGELREFIAPFTDECPIKNLSLRYELDTRREACLTTEEEEK